MGNVGINDNNAIVQDDGKVLATSFDGDGSLVTNVDAISTTITGKVNEAGGITKGQAVYISGATGNFPQISLADNTLHEQAHTLGIASSTATDGQSIDVITVGLLIGVNSSGFVAGNRLHLITGGAMQAAVASNGAHIHMGFAIKIGVSDGIYFVAPEIYTHDIRATSDIDVKLACGSDDNTGKIIIQNWSGAQLGFFDGAGLFQWDGIVEIGKIRVSTLGYIAIKLTNKTGGASVEGELLETSTVTANAVALAQTGDLDPIGSFLESGVADGAEAWVVVMGIAEVKADATGFSKGDRLVMSTATNGRVEANNAPAVAAHFTEIGHALEDAAANAVGKAVLHFL